MTAPGPNPRGFGAVLANISRKPFEDRQMDQASAETLPDIVTLLDFEQGRGVPSGYGEAAAQQRRE